MSFNSILFQSGGKREWEDRFTITIPMLPGAAYPPSGLDIARAVLAYYADPKRWHSTKEVFEGDPPEWGFQDFWYPEDPAEDGSEFRFDGYELAQWALDLIEQVSPPSTGKATRLRRFYFQRDHDISGQSGTGRVVEGVQFSNGWVGLTWLTDITSLSFYPSVADAIAIHGHSGSTQLVWVDE